MTICIRSKRVRITYVIIGLLLLFLFFLGSVFLLGVFGWVVRERAKHNDVEYLDMTWSPNGKFVLLHIYGEYVAAGNHLYLASRDDPNVLQPIYEYEAWNSVGNTFILPPFPIWLPQSDAVVIVDEAGNERPQRRDIFLQKLDGSPAINLTDHTGTDHAPSISPDGAEIAFASDRTGEYQLYRLGIAGSNLVQLTKLKDIRITETAWSPDGATIALIVDYSSTMDDFDRKEVLLFDLDTGMMTNLTHKLANYVRLRWSTDGKRLAFVKIIDDKKIGDDNQQFIVIDPPSSAVLKTLAVHSEYPFISGLTQFSL